MFCFVFPSRRQKSTSLAFPKMKHIESSVSPTFCLGLVFWARWRRNEKTSSRRSCLVPFVGGISAKLDWWNQNDGEITLTILNNMLVNPSQELPDAPFISIYGLCSSTLGFVRFNSFGGDEHYISCARYSIHKRLQARNCDIPQEF